MKQYINPQWQYTLLNNGFNQFEKIWQLPSHWVDGINKRGDGWSGVSRVQLNLPSGEARNVYVKRQQNYGRRYRPSMPVLEQEFNNIQRMHNLKIPTLTPIYFGKQKTTEGLQAVLITEALIGFQSLQDWLQYWQIHGWPSYAEQVTIINVMANTIKCLHRFGMIHGCLYPKHIFLSLDKEEPEIRLIDLEKCRYWPLVRHRTVRDLSTLSYYTREFSRTQQIRFFLAYLHQSRIDNHARHLIRLMKKRLQQKGRV